MEHLHTQVRSGMYEGHTSNPRLPVTFRPKETLIGNITPAHWHEHPEILHIIRGTVRIYIQGRVYQAAPGDLVIINPGETHAIPERENGSLYECIIPHRTLCDKMGISFEDHPLPNLIRDEPCEGYFRKIMQELSEKKELYEISAQLGILELILHLMRRYPARVSPKDRPGSAGERMVKQAITYIQENYSRAISTDDVCRHLGFDKSYVCTTFKKITGSTIISFLNMTRCTHARDLLLSGGTCVAECALRCGFQHLSYFTKTYKRYMGELPSQTACAKRLPLS